MSLDHTSRANGHECECFCDMCNPDETIGFISCTCDECDPEGEGIYCMNVRQDQLDLERIRERAMREYSDGCSRSFYDYLFRCVLECDTREEKDSIVIASFETVRQIIEIRKEEYGYSTSAICKIDNFTGKTIFSTNLEEAEEELKRYTLESIASESEDK